MTNAPLIQIAGGMDHRGKTPGFMEISKDGYVALAHRLLPHIEGRWSRILLKNPGGWHLKPGNDKYKMWSDQWGMAKHIGARYAVDWELKHFCDVMQSAGVTEIIMYIGTHLTLADPLKEGRRNVAPYLDCSEIVSMGFDADSAITAPEHAALLPAILEHYAEIRAKGHKVYVESRVHQDNPELYQHIDGTIALENTDLAQPKRLDNALRFAPLKEAIRMTDAAGDTLEVVKKWAPEFTVAMRDYKEFAAADVGRAA